MHNAGFAALGLNAAYLPLRAADADDFVTFARATRHARRQHHGAVQGRADADRSTRPTRWRAASAPSTRIVVRDGRWFGDRTRTSTASSLPWPDGWRCKGTRAAVLGAGGAARAVAVALADGGADRLGVAPAAPTPRRRSPATPRRASAPCRRRRGAGTSSSTPPPAGTAAATTSPMAGVALDGAMVYDLVYEPAETPLLRRRARRGVPDDRRARHAHRPGRAAVRVVDRAAPAGRRLFADAAAHAAGRERPAAPAGQPVKQTTLRRIRGRCPARHVRAGRQGNHRRPAHAGLRVPEDRRALRLRLPVRERRRGRAASRATRSSARTRSSSCARARGRPRSSAPG